MRLIGAMIQLIHQKRLIFYNIEIQAFHNDVE